MNLALAVPLALKSHASVKNVVLVGSRAEGRVTRFSDWDFVISDRRFPEVARTLPQLVAILLPIAHQWDRLSETACYMLILAGPIKVDLIFAGVPHKPERPWQVTPDTLGCIDMWTSALLANPIDRFQPGR